MMASSPFEDLCHTQYETQPLQLTDGAGAAEPAFTPFSFLPGINYSTRQSYYDFSLDPSARPAAVGPQLQSSLYNTEPSPDAAATDVHAGGGAVVDALAPDVELSVSDMFTLGIDAENPGNSYIYY